MAKLILVLGGARSGKSAFAVELGKQYERVTYMATAKVLDEEMTARVKLHQKMRPKHWKTFEVPTRAHELVPRLYGQTDVIIIDCITVYIANMLLDDNHKERKAEYVSEEITKLCEVGKRSAADIILVSNEVGQGIVPDNPMSRQFRDIAGSINQFLAKEAGAVYFLTAGIPQKIK